MTNTVEQLVLKAIKANKTLSSILEIASHDASKSSYIPIYESCISKGDIAHALHVAELGNIEIPITELEELLQGCLGSGKYYYLEPLTERIGRALTQEEIDTVTKNAFLKHYPWNLNYGIFLLKPSLSVAATCLLNVMEGDKDPMIFDQLFYSMEKGVDTDYFDQLIHEIGISSKTVKYLPALAKACAKQNTIDQLAVCASRAPKSHGLLEKYIELKPSKKALDEMGLHAAHHGWVRSIKEYRDLLGVKPKMKHCELMIQYAIKKPFHFYINGDTRKQYGRILTVDEYFIAAQNCLARNDLLEAVRISNADRCSKDFLNDLHEQCLATGDFSLASDSVRLLERELNEDDFEKLTQAAS